MRSFGQERLASFLRFMEELVFTQIGCSIVLRDVLVVFRGICVVKSYTVYVVLSIHCVKGTHESPESCRQRVQFAGLLWTEAQGSNGTSFLFKFRALRFHHIVVLLQMRPRGGISPPFCQHEVRKDLEGWVVGFHIITSSCE
jgi:hypothetical protein